jgi:hypothetical protein
LPDEPAASDDSESPGGKVFSQRLKARRAAAPTASALAVSGNDNCFVWRVVEKIFRHVALVRMDLNPPSGPLCATPIHVLVFLALALIALREIFLPIISHIFLCFRECRTGRNEPAALQRVQQCSPQRLVARVRFQVDRVSVVLVLDKAISGKRHNANKSFRLADICPLRKR